ncbi:hypothetical protein [Chitinophaga rhizosphaerae]|uniref:hypothetical protein n=1 Tax=Chitinophaga rhizosphaerae TaxID=1864947 RepID=UPI000F80E8B4|nr:hypothetical protein [Chitinophaga rhizosphaerae]
MMLPEKLNGLGGLQIMQTLYQGVRSTHPTLVKWIESDFDSDKIDNAFVMDMVLHSLQFLEEALVLSADESMLRSSEPDVRASLADMDLVAHWVKKIRQSRNLYRSEAAIKSIQCLYKTIAAYYFDAPAGFPDEVAGTALLAAFAGSGLVNENTAANITALFVDRGKVTEKDWQEWDEITRAEGLDGVFRAYVEDQVRKVRVM